MTAAEWEGVFVNPAILFGRMPFQMVMYGNPRQARFGWCIRVLTGLLLPLVIVGGILGQ